MKLYSLYEFPRNEQELSTIIKYIDEYQPVRYNVLLDVISETIIKASSRTNITLKMLRKLGFIEGQELINLSPITQIYQDLNKPLQDLTIYLVYKNKDLFETCKLIFDITEDSQITNTSLVKELNKIGYTDKKRTAQEKIYALKRLISLCKNGKITNPFLAYEEYIDFLITLKDQYIYLCENKIDEPISIQKLKKRMNYIGISNKLFDEYFLKLYNDPIYSSYTSFTTVINEFAHDKYYRILDKDYYFFKLSDFKIERR